MEFKFWHSGRSCAVYGCSNEATEYECYMQLNAVRECDQQISLETPLKLTLEENEQPDK